MQSKINNTKILTHIDFNIKLESVEEIRSFKHILDMAGRHMDRDSNNRYIYEGVHQLIDQLNKTLYDASVT